MTSDLQRIAEARELVESSRRHGGPDVVSYSELATENRALRLALRDLIGIVDRNNTRSVRLAAQADEEFVNFARAARTEIHAAQGALKRLGQFEQALTRIVWPEDGTQ